MQRSGADSVDYDIPESSGLGRPGQLCSIPVDWTVVRWDFAYGMGGVAALETETES